MKLKKGQKVIRYSGYSATYPKVMHTGDVGTVEKNQIHVGTVEIKEFPGGHDPGRLIRIDNLPEVLFKPFKKLVKKLDTLDIEDTNTRQEILCVFLDGYTIGVKNG